ncbi:pollen-specific leucine-rich repeat extensin-like protein 4 [Iris pallida]|uniref:Pollen-specific leucine-rich repeat extensin-like protein 4 n=1 Tax=Iris pallida TaxID=29817 RepID=A0AAX6GBR2_IRIPA|nr:pollen-specific leucine-rich repeat extensin-like protein 4 [Iris pallida]
MGRGWRCAEERTATESRWCWLVGCGVSGPALWVPVARPGGEARRTALASSRKAAPQSRRRPGEGSRDGDSPDLRRRLTVRAGCVDLGGGASHHGRGRRRQGDSSSGGGDEVFQRVANWWLGPGFKGCSRWRRPRRRGTVRQRSQDAVAQRGGRDGNNEAGSTQRRPRAR